MKWPNRQNTFWESVFLWICMKYIRFDFFDCQNILTKSKLQLFECKYLKIKLNHHFV